MTHQFGNYVLQKAIGVVLDPVLRVQILQSIKNLSASLCQTKYGNKVIHKLQKVHPEIFRDVLNAGCSDPNSSQASIPSV